MKEEDRSWDWPLALAFITCGSIGFVAVGAIADFVDFGMLGKILLWGVLGAILGITSYRLNRSR